MRLLILFAFLALIAVPVAAQQRDSGDARRVIEQAKRGNWFLRVYRDTGAIQGRVTALVRDSAALFVRERVRYADVTRIERRTRQGSLAGPAAIGSGLVLGGFSMLFAAGMCEGECGSAAIVGAAAGATLGGVFGGLIGSAISPGKLRWTTIWPDSIPEPPALRSTPSSVNGATFQIGLLLLEGESDALVGIPTFFSFQISRDHRRFETLPIGFTLAYAKSEAGYFGVESGLNYRIGPAGYVGATAGLGADFDKARPIVGLRVGVGRPSSRLRFELRGNGRVSDGFHASAYAILGYTLRPSAGRQ
jgi:hypothetical protein